MKKYLYYQPEDIRDESLVAIFNEQQQQVATVQRIYRNGLTKLLDGYFDYRYFLTYDVVENGALTYRTKKIIRRGKLWYECVHMATNEKYIISYQNWRIGVPELFISQKNTPFKMMIDKVMEGWSRFYVGEQEVARWQAVFEEDKARFLIILEVEEQAPQQDVGFYISIAQAALFIGV